MSPLVVTAISLGSALVAFVVAFRLGIIYRKKIAEAEIGSAEEQAKKILIKRLPEYLQPQYEKILDSESAPEWPYVKAADTLSAYIKCVSEINAGNKEFITAEKKLYKKLEEYPLPALKIFMEEFLPAYSQTLDES